MTLRVVQVSCVIDHRSRDPEALLEAWPTLPAVATATARAGADVTVLQASKLMAEYRRDGVVYRFVPEPRFRKGSGPGILPWRLAAAIKREAPDIVHFNGLDFPFHAHAASSLGIPMLVQDHGSRPDSRLSPLRRWGYEQAAAAAFTSRTQAEPFLGRRQLPVGIPVVAIPECTSGFTPGDSEAARRETGVFGDPALLWVGHLNRNKDPLTIFHAVRKTLSQLPDPQLWCVFMGAELLPEVKELLRRDRTLAAHVHLIGRVAHERIETLCRASDFFLLGSHRESTGYALIEALACGLPPIVSDIPSFNALTGGGDVGALAPVGDSDAFAKAIVALAARPREALRLNVANHFARHLSFDIVGARLMAAYEKIAANSRRL